MIRLVVFFALACACTAPQKAEVKYVATCTAADGATVLAVWANPALTDAQKFAATAVIVTACAPPKTAPGPGSGSAK